MVGRVLLGAALAALFVAWLVQEPVEPAPTAQEAGEVPEGDAQVAELEEGAAVHDAAPEVEARQEVASSNPAATRTLPVRFEFGEGAEPAPVTLVLHVSDHPGRGGPGGGGQLVEHARVEAPPGGIDLEIPQSTRRLELNISAPFLVLDRPVSRQVESGSSPLDPSVLQLLPAGGLCFRLISPNPAPIPDADLVGRKVFLESYPTGSFFRGHPRTTKATIGEGLEVRVMGLSPKECYTLTGTAVPYTYIRSREVTPVPGEVHEVEVPLKRGLSISGQVIDPDGKPLPNAHLWVAWKSGTGQGGGRRDVGKDGRFQLHGVRTDLFAIHGRHGGLLQGTVLRSDMPPGYVIEDVVIQLRHGDLLEGRVVTPDGIPVQAATVKIKDGPSTRTDPDGAFRFRQIEDREHKLSVTCGLGSPRADATFRTAREGRGWRAAGSGRPGEEVVLTLVAPELLQFTVAGPQGQPVREVEIKAIRSTAKDDPFTWMITKEEAELKGDEAGRYSWELPRGEWRVRVAARAYGFAADQVVNLPGPEVNIELPLLAPCSGVVLDEFGAPVQGALVRGYTRAHGQTHNEDVHTDAQGQFRILLHPGAGMIHARLAGYAPSEMHMIELDGSDDPTELTLRSPGKIRCTVLDGSGKPLAGSTLSIADSHVLDWPPPQTDAAGKALLVDIPPGTHELQAYKDKTPVRQTVEVKAGEITDVVFQ